MSSAISVRLDSDALRALAQIESTGLSRSEAIRKAILESAARLRRRDALTAEVAALEADEDDRREMLEVADFMESMRAAR
jgi:predicted transcriptional regulator